MQRQRIPERLLNDPYWRAVGVALQEAFPNDRRVWEHVDVDDQLIDFPAILGEGTWSGGERRFLAGLAGLWNLENDKMIGLGELIVLSDHYWDRLVGAASELRRGLR